MVTAPRAADAPLPPGDPRLRQARTARLSLRPVARDDLDVLASLFGDPRVTAHRPDPRPDSRAEVAARLEADLADWAARGWGRWLASDAGGPVGVTGLSPAEAGAALNLSYHVLPARWGAGLAGEMARAALALAFGPLGAARVITLIRPANPASARVAEKLGFVFEAEVALRGAPTRKYALTPALAAARGIF